MGVGADGAARGVRCPAPELELDWRVRSFRQIRRATMRSADERSCYRTRSSRWISCSVRRGGGNDKASKCAGLSSRVRAESQARQHRLDRRTASHVGACALHGFRANDRQPYGRVAGLCEPRRISAGRVSAGACDPNAPRSGPATELNLGAILKLGNRQRAYEMME